MNKKVLERQEGQGNEVGFFVCFILFFFNIFKFSFCGERYDGVEGQIWRDGEMSRIVVQDVKFPKNQ